MSYSTLPAPADLFGMNSALRSRAFPLSTEHRRDSDSHSPMSEPRSPLYRTSLTAEFPPHLATLYNSPYAAAAVAAAVAGQGTGGVTTPSPFGPYARTPGAAAFYSGMVGGEAWRRSPYLSQLDLWPHLRSLEAVVGPRTKAPREATSILKSWLNEHKDNPYPTKSEKMTLSLVTHMTLTQVSTWFANARRRIKKENKMTWTPKTRCGERDGNSSNEEENEKDYYGRHRSPFSMHDSSDGAVRRPSAECDASRRSLFDQAATSSSRAYPSHDAARKPPAHPFFAAFTAGLHSQYGNPTGASLEDVLKQRVLLKENVQGLGRPISQQSSSSSSDSPPSTCNNEVGAKKNNRSSPSAFSRQVFCRGGPSLLSPTEQDKATFGEQKSPFVRLSKDRSTGTDAEECDNSEESPNESACDLITTKGDREVASHSPFSLSSKTEEKEMKEDEVSNDEDESTASNPVEAYSPKNESQKSHFCPPSYATGEFTANSASYANMDALSCWIRDFQRLVSSGQENKAKQALATALAVAAKAGAYSSMNGATANAQQASGSRFSGAESSSDAVQNHALSPLQSNRTFRFLPLDVSRKRRISHSEDVVVLSPEKSLRRSSSPITPPASHAVLRMRSREPSADEAPMNLTKPTMTSSKDWTLGEMADDAPTEA